MLFMLVYITAIMTLQYAVICACCFHRGLVCFISTSILFPYGAVVVMFHSVCFYASLSGLLYFMGLSNPSRFNVWLRYMSGCIIQFFAGSYFANSYHRSRHSSFGTVTRIQDGRLRNLSLFPAASKPSKPSKPSLGSILRYREQSGRSVERTELTAQQPPVLRLRISKAISPFPHLASWRGA
jgi:hypothetical protein